MSLLRILAVFALCAGSCFADAKPPAAPAALLPPNFAGWQISGSPKISKDPAAADPTNAAVLKEYGFADFEGATYTREDGRKLTVKAARFDDASGAYGAFTFYETPDMIDEKIGDQGSSSNLRVLFYRGNILVDAAFQQFSAMSGAALRELADNLPRPPGTTANLPGLLAYLPKTSFVKNTSKYVVGPLALEKIGSPLPVQYIDFSKGAEVVLGDYNFSGAPATFFLIGYPTPQIAAAQIKRIEAAQQSHQLGGTTVSTRRTGPIVEVLSGAVSSGDARSLLSSVNYDANVTWNENTYFTRRDNVANLIVGVILLAAIVGGISIVAGFAFGGFRLAVKRLFPNKVFDRPEQIEIICLHLDEEGRERRDSL